MDVLAVRKAGASAIAASRQGEGPVLLECKTYRFVGHSRSDVNGYRTRDEEAQWRERESHQATGRGPVGDRPGGSG